MLEKKKDVRKTFISLVAVTLFLALVLVLDQVIKPSNKMYMLLTVLQKGSVYALAAVSMNLLNGFTGLFSLGQAGFMLLGAYTYAILTIPAASQKSIYQRYANGGIGFSIPELLSKPLGGFGLLLGVVFCLILAGFIAALFAFLIGLPVLKLKSDYLAIATLGFAEIIRVVMQNIDGVLGFTLTGGAKGLTGIPSYTNFLNTFIVVAISLFLIHTMMKSRHGRAILAIRDNEIAAEASGVSTTYYKTLAFVVSAFFAGVGGALYAGCIGVMDPSKFGFMKSVEILVMVVLGGMGSMLGSVVSASVLTILPEALRAFSEFRMVAYAVVLILVMIFRPQGLFGSYDFSLSRVVERCLNKDFPWKKKPTDSSEPAQEVIAHE